MADMGSQRFPPVLRYHINEAIYAKHVTAIIIMSLRLIKLISLNHCLLYYFGMVNLLHAIHLHGYPIIHYDKRERLSPYLEA
jgi:hypothetical protein